MQDRAAFRFCCFFTILKPPSVYRRSLGFISIYFGSILVLLLISLGYFCFSLGFAYWRFPCNVACHSYFISYFIFTGGFCPVNGVFPQVLKGPLLFFFASLAPAVFLFFDRSTQLSFIYMLSFVDGSPSTLFFFSRLYSPIFPPTSFESHTICARYEFFGEEGSPNPPPSVS